MKTDWGEKNLRLLTITWDIFQWSFSIFKHIKDPKRVVYY